MRTPAFTKTNAARSAAAASGSGGFTLVEILVALTLGAVVFAASLAAVVNLQKSYAATEQYAASLSDQMRLVDYLSMDLRRARTVTFDANGYGVTLALPDYLSPNPGDPTNPLPRNPTVADDHARAIYGDPVNSPRVYYHFNTTPGSSPLTGNITREEAGAGQALTNKAPAQVRVADNVAAKSADPAKSALAPFAWMIALTPNDGINPPLQAQVTASFHPMFQTPATPDTNFITLHNTIFLRNNDSHR